MQGKGTTYYYTNCFLIRKSDNRVLLSVRADTKEFAPGCYDFSVRGHKWGDPSGTMRREIWLQMGIKQEVRHFARNENKRGNVKSVADLFIGYFENDPTWFNPIEIKELQYKSLAEIQELLKSDKEKFIAEYELGFEKLTKYLDEVKYAESVTLLSFAEELLQGGISFHNDAKEEGFVEDEFGGNMWNAWRDDMKRLHNLWRENSDGLKNEAASLSDYLPSHVSVNIKGKSWVRLLILKSLHNLSIDKMSFDENTNIFSVMIKHKPIFDSLSFYGELSMNFCTKNFKYANVEKISALAKNNDVRIYGTDIRFNNSAEIEIALYIAYYDGEEVDDFYSEAEDDPWTIKFICNDLRLDVT